MKTLIPIFFMLAFFIGSCTKDIPVVSDDSPPVLDTIPITESIPSHWAINGQNKGDIVYDNWGRVVHVRLYDTPERFDSMWYDDHTEYNFEGSSNKLVTARTATWGSLPRNAIYFYGDDEYVDSIIIRTDGGDERDTIRFQYDFSNDCPLVSYSVVKHDRTTNRIKTFEYLYEYTDTNCSYIKTNFAEGVFTGKYSTEFGNGHSFYNPTSFEWPIMTFFNKKPVVKNCSHEEDGTVKSCSERVYEYNGLDLVIKETIPLSNGTERVIEYFYK